MLPLHTCPLCESDLVQPVHREHLDAGRWELLRRCPECRWHGLSIHTDDEVRAYDEAMELATAMVVEALRQITDAPVLHS